MYTANYRIFDYVVLGLTPAERLRAAGRFDSSDTGLLWFIVIGVVALVVMIVALVVVSRKRTGSGGRKDINFFDQARKKGLSTRESQILLHVAKLVGLKHTESIFTMSRAFDVGAGKLTSPNSVLKMTPEQIKQLTRELSYLREKLGFQKHVVSAAEPVGTSHERSSREIPVGKIVHMTRRVTRNSEDIDAMVVKNTDTELIVKFAVAVESGIGDRWRVRYYYGASVWEFDVSVAGSEGEVLILSHSDSIRFINRRRFLRVPVCRKAYIATFAFEKDVQFKKSQPGTEAADSFDSGDVLPRFVPATVIELAGPGLRIETSLKLKIGQRVALVFSLDTDDDTKNAGGITQPSAAIKVVEDIGMVRHVAKSENGYSVAVELTGLSDSDVDELIRATNAAAMQAKINKKNTAEPSEQKEKVSELVAAQGD